MVAVEMVVAAGVPRVATPSLGARLRELGLRGRSMTVGGVTRWANGGAQKHRGDEPKAHSRATTAGMLRAVEG